MPRRLKRINPSKSLKLRLSPEVLMRFLAKIRKDDTHWVWTGYADENGYGQFRVGSKVLWAHRVARRCLERRMKRRGFRAPMERVATSFGYARRGSMIAQVELPTQTANL